MTNFITSIKNFKPAAAFITLAAAAMLSAGDLTSDSIPDDNLQSIEFGLTGGGNANVSSMAAFATAFLHDDEVTSLPYLFKAVAANPESASLVKYLLSQINRSKDKKIYSDQLVKMAQRDPSSLRLSLSAIIILSRDNKRKEAMELAIQSYQALRDKDIPLEAEPMFISLVRLAGAFMMEDKRYSDAVKLYKEIMDNPRYGDNPAILEGAALVFDKAAKYASTNKFLWVFDSDREDLEDDRDRMIKKLTAMNDEKYNPEACNALYALYKSLERNDEAYRVLLTRIIHQPNITLTRKLLALTCFRENEYQLSFYTWQALSELTKLDSSDYMMFGEAAWKSGNDGFAEIIFASHINKNPRSLKTKLMLAMLLYDNGKSDQAWKLLEKLPPTSISLHLKSLIAVKQHKYSEALKYMQEIEKLYAERKAKMSPGMYVSMSYMAEKAGNIALFEKCIKDMYKLEPKRKAEWDNSIGYVLADHNIRLDEAEKLIRAAVTDQKGKPEYLDSLAWVLYRQNRYEEARKCIDQAISEQHDVPDAVIADHAGDIYHSLGDNKTALKYWQLALKIYDPEINPELVKAKIGKVTTKNAGAPAS